MGTLPRIKLTRTDPFHHEISIQGLRLDDVALEIMRRHPESDWPEVISLALTAGLAIFNRVDGPHQKLLERQYCHKVLAPRHSNHRNQGRTRG